MRRTALTLPTANHDEAPLTVQTIASPGGSCFKSNSINVIARCIRHDASKLATMWTLVRSSAETTAGIPDISLPDEGVSHILQGRHCTQIRVIRTFDPKVDHELGRISLSHTLFVYHY